MNRNQIAKIIGNAIGISILCAILLIMSASLWSHFLQTELYQRHLAWAKPVPTIHVQSLDELSAKACADKARVVVVHYYKIGDSDSKDVDATLQILNRQMKDVPVRIFSIALDALPPAERPHADTAIDTVSLHWNAVEAGVIGGAGPQMASWHNYPLSYEDLKREIRTGLSSARYYEAQAKGTTASNPCEEVLKGILELPREHL